MSTRTTTRPTTRRPAAPAAERFARRRRSVSRRRWLLRGAVVATVALVGLASWAVGWSSLLGVRQVEVRQTVMRGASQLPPSLVQQTADVTPGTPLARVDLGAVRSRVESIPSVATAQVHRAWPSTLVIQVVVRVPVLAVRTGGGWQLVDRTGVAYRTVAEPPAGLPVLTPGPDAPDQATVQAMAAVAAGLPASLARQVRSVSASSPDDVTLQLASGARVLWGSADETARKAQVLAVLLAGVGGRGVTLYDVRAPDAPATR